MQRNHSDGYNVISLMLKNNWNLESDTV